MKRNGLRSERERKIWDAAWQAGRRSGFEESKQWHKQRGRDELATELRQLLQIPSQHADEVWP